MSDASVPTDQLGDEVAGARDLAARVAGLIEGFRSEGLGAGAAVDLLQELQAALLAFAENPSDPQLRLEADALTRLFMAVTSGAFAG